MYHKYHVKGATGMATGARKAAGRGMGYAMKRRKYPMNCCKGMNSKMSMKY